MARGADRDDVAETDDRGGPIGPGQQPPHSLVAAFWGVAFLDHSSPRQGQPMALERLTDPFDAIEDPVIVRRYAGNHGNVGVPELDEEIDDLRGGPSVVEAGARVSRRRIEDIGVDEWNVARFQQFVQPPIMRVADQDETFRAALDKNPGLLELADGIEFGVRDQQRVSGLPESRLDRRRHAGVDGMVQGREDRTARARATRPQGPCRMVRRIAQRFDGRDHPFDDLGTHLVRRVDGPRDGRGRTVGRLGHVHHPDSPLRGHCRLLGSSSASKIRASEIDFNPCSPLP